ncbi:type II secretion system F family protein [Orbus sturtevantii]|uniref:type II secretion system F family protein n=1 Tax=Orbus sturtevantii TaxID=3074109 RepID=UPI00370D7CDA
MAILFSAFLIVFSAKELFYSYRYYQRKQTLDLLLNVEKAKEAITVATKKNKNIAFEKIVAKNSLGVSFLQRFQDQHLWKIYAIVILFSTLFIINNFINFIELSQTAIIVSLFVIICLVIIVPERLVKAQTEKKIRGVSRDLPLVIDLIAIMIKSGMTIETSFTYLSSRVKTVNPDIASIFERACLMMEVNGIAPAIDLIYREVPSKEMRMFCTTLKRSINYGNSIYEVLLDLSFEIREIQRLSIEEKIAAISAKMTVPMMIFILFPVLVIVAGPVMVKLFTMF